LVDEAIPAGKHEVVFNTEGLNSGIYFCEFKVRQLFPKQENDRRQIKIQIYRLEFTIRILNINLQFYNQHGLERAGHFFLPGRKIRSV